MLRAASLLLPIVLFIPQGLRAQAPQSQPASRPTPEAASQPASRPSIHGVWNGLLRRHVHGGRIDYRALGKEPADLRAYLDRMAEVQVADLTKGDRLAYYINLYNATMVEAVLEHRKRNADWTPAADSWGVFDEKRVRLASGRVSLNHLENKIIRKQWQEPRIHVALVCGAVSCPPILNRAWTGADLEKLLAQQMRRFVGDTARNRIDHDAKTLQLSSIFDWYAKDFGGKEQLAAYVNRYTEKDVGGYSVEFRTYDWSLNEKTR